MVKLEPKELLGGTVECEVGCSCMEGPNAWLDAEKQNAFIKKSSCQIEWIDLRHVVYLL